MKMFGKRIQVKIRVKIIILYKTPDISSPSVIIQHFFSLLQLFRGFLKSFLHLGQQFRKRYLERSISDEIQSGRNEAVMLLTVQPQSGSNLIEEIIAAARIGRRKPAAFQIPA